MSAKRHLKALVLGVSLAAITPGALADEVKRMGILFAGAAEQRSTLEEVLIATLREQGYVEGRNLQITRRYAAGDYTRLAGYARELEA